MRKSTIAFIGGWVVLSLAFLPSLVWLFYIVIFRYPDPYIDQDIGISILLMGFAGVFAAVGGSIIMWAKERSRLDRRDKN